MSHRNHAEDIGALNPYDDEPFTPLNYTGCKNTSPGYSFRQRCHEEIGPNLGHLNRCYDSIEVKSRLKAKIPGVASYLGSARLHPGTKGFREDFEKLCPERAALECTISLENTIAAFVAAELKPEDAIHHLVVLTGKIHKMWATTCEEYVSRTWPKVSDQVMLLYMLISKPQATKGDKFTYLGPSISPDRIGVKLMADTKSYPTDKGHRLRITLEARREPMLDIIEAVAWLFATLYNAPELALRGVQLDLQPGYSDLNFNLIGDRMTPASKVSHEWSSTCWLPLMLCYPIPVDFETPARDLKIKGIEVSFQLMCFLCGVEYAVEEEGATVLYGQKSMVRPTQAINDCVEWHFQGREDTFEGRDEEPQQKAGPFLSIGELESWSTQKRHFLGLWADPVVTLGTSISNVSDIAYSQADEARYTSSRQGRQIGGTIACPKTFSLTWTEIYTVTKNRRNVYMDDFESKVHARRNTPVMLYSVSEKRAWIVSFLSVLWHLARARSECQRVLGFEIPPCAMSADGGLAALNKILECYRQPLKRPKPNERLNALEQNLKIKDYLNQVWAALECATRETNRARRPFSRTIYGYEMADIALLKPDLYLKKHKLDFGQGWTPLVDEVRLVLFYEGLHDPIQSNRDHIQRAVCSNTIWPTIPTGFNLLTASIPCLINIAERFGPDLNRLTSRHQWHSPIRGQLLGPCEKTIEHTCDRLQEVRSIAAGRGAPLDPPARNFPRDQRGAVVFKYRAGMERIQRNLNISGAVHPPPPASTQAALEPGYPDNNLQGVNVPPSASLYRDQGERIQAPRRRPPPPTSFPVYNAHMPYASDSGYSTVPDSPATGPLNMYNQVADDATETSSIELWDDTRRSDSQRRPSRLDIQERRQQPPPPAIRAQQPDRAERVQDHSPRGRSPKRTRRRRRERERRQSSPRWCVVM